MREKTSRLRIPLLFQTSSSMNNVCVYSVRQHTHTLRASHSDAEWALNPVTFSSNARLELLLDTLTHDRERVFELILSMAVCVRVCVRVCPKRGWRGSDV